MRLFFYCGFCAGERMEKVYPQKKEKSDHFGEEPKDPILKDTILLEL